MTRTTVTGAYDGGTYGAVERVSHHMNDRGGDRPLKPFGVFMRNARSWRRVRWNAPLVFQTTTARGLCRRVRRAVICTAMVLRQGNVWWFWQ